MGLEEESIKNYRKCAMKINKIPHDKAIIEVVRISNTIETK